MVRRSLAVFLVAAAIAAVGAQGQSTAQPTLTPQNSGTTSGLIDPIQPNRTKMM